MPIFAQAAPGGANPTPNMTIGRDANGNWAWTDPSPGQPLPGAINQAPPTMADQSKALAQTALNSLPGRGGWQVVTSQPDDKDPTHSTVWIGNTATGQTDMMVIDQNGQIITPPTEKIEQTPSETKGDTTPWADNNGGWWVNNPKDPAHPTKVEGPSGAKATTADKPWNDDAGNWWVNNPNDSSHPIKVEGPQAGAKPAANPYPGGVIHNDDGSITGIGPDGKAVQVQGPVAKQAPPMSDYEKTMSDLTAKRDQTTADAQTASQHAQEVANDLKARADEWNKQYQQGQLNEQEYRDHLTDINQQAQTEIAKANQALESARDAQTKWYQQQQIGLQQQGVDVQKGQLAQTTAQNAAQNALAQQGGERETAKMLADQENSQANRAVQTQASTIAGANTGASILNQRAANATGLVNNVVGLASGNKNLGLGTQLPSGWGAGLVSGIQDWTGQMSGGNDVLNAATNLVKQANPQLAQSPAGGDVVQHLADMLNKYKQLTGQDHPVTAAVQPPAQPVAPPPPPSLGPQFAPVVSPSPIAPPPPQPLPGLAPGDNTLGPNFGGTW
jgi:hypothetical protein